jgi:ribosome biogenesis GTPase / thiamine phosphate phosphatase
MDRATVLRVDRKRAVVDLADGTHLEAVVRGRLHHGDRRETNPVAVGDVVRVERTGEGTCAIVEVEPRRSALLRPEIWGRWKRQVLVANPDNAILVFAYRDPPPAAGLVDRLLFACHAGSVTATLVFNKADLDASPETEALVVLYERLGYRVLRTSALRGDLVEELRALVAGRCTVFAGPSGSGKSSLINRVLPGVTLRTGEISRATGKGQHTTTASQLVRDPLTGGYVIDTPGVREFGIAGIDPREAALHFPEFPAPGTCRFDDCRHVSEPGCVVRAALAAGTVPPSRYASYLTFLGELEEEARRDLEGSASRPSGPASGGGRGSGRGGRR